MSGTERDTVSVRQDMRLIGPGRMIVPLKAVWTYSRQDPYAVRASFDADAGEPVNWVFDRDLLVAALHGPAGIGDVRAWPTVEPDPAAKRPGARKKIFNIAVGPPADCVHFEASAAVIGAFLARAYELVPAGSESACLDFDDELTELLSQA
jgi:sporulation and cell division protein SsgA